MIVIATVKVPGSRYREKYEYMETYFEERRYPEAIFVGDEVIPGPFCLNCGSPEQFHGMDDRRPPLTCPPPPPLRKRIVLDTRPDARKIQ